MKEGPDGWPWNRRERRAPLGEGRASSGEGLAAAVREGCASLGERRRVDAPKGSPPGREERVAEGRRRHAARSRVAEGAGTRRRRATRRAPSVARCRLGFTRRAVPPGRTGIARAGARSGLGGQQVEGRQAVRELLMAGRRKVREIWLSNDLDRTTSSPRSSTSPSTSGCRSWRSVARSSTPRPAARRRRGCSPRRRRCRRPSSPSSPAPVRAGPPFLVAVDGVTDPGNLGALMRSAEGAGVHGVVLPRAPGRPRDARPSPRRRRSDRARADGARSRAAGRAVGDAQARASGWSASTTRPTGRCSSWATSPSSGICLVMGAEGAGLRGWSASGAT